MTPHTLSGWAADLGLTPRRMDDGYEWTGQVKAPVTLPRVVWRALGHNTYACDDRYAILVLTSEPDSDSYETAHAELRSFRMAAPYNAQVAQLRRAGGGR